MSRDASVVRRFHPSLVRAADPYWHENYYSEPHPADVSSQAIVSETVLDVRSEQPGIVFIGRRLPEEVGRSESGLMAPATPSAATLQFHERRCWTVENLEYGKTSPASAVPGLLAFDCRDYPYSMDVLLNTPGGQAANVVHENASLEFIDLVYVYTFGGSNITAPQKQAGASAQGPLELVVGTVVDTETYISEIASLAGFGRAIAGRLRELDKQKSPEEGEPAIATSSLKSFFHAVRAVGNLKPPAISLTEDGNLYATWRDAQRVFSVLFLPDDKTQFAILRPDPDGVLRQIRSSGSAPAAKVLKMPETSAATWAFA